MPRKRVRRVVRSYKTPPAPVPANLGEHITRLPVGWAGETFRVTAPRVVVGWFAALTAREHGTLAAQPYGERQQ